MKSFLAAVAQYRVVAWMATAIVAAFFVGVGMTTQYGAAAQSLKLVPEIKATVERNVQRLDNVEAKLSDAGEARARILCIVELTATGERILAAELERVVNECMEARK